MKVMNLFFRALNEAKMEANQNLDSSSDTKEPMEYCIQIKEENETEDIPVKEIKRETEFEKIDTIYPESEYSITPVWFEVPVKREKDSPEIKYSSTQEYLKVGETTISERRKPEIATYTKGLKQEPMDVDQTDPDDVTTQSIPEGSEQHEMTDVKYVNTQDNLDIGETVICEQDRAISEQDRARPGTSLKGDNVSYHTNIHKYNETSLITGQKPFECDICGYQCIQPSNLRRHMKTHTQQKPYKCEICGYQCRLGSGLKRHKKTHTAEKPRGAKPYKCEICDYNCRKSSLLERHLRTHTGEKPYKCEICDFKCRQQGNLKLHMTKHTAEKPYKCEICDYKCGYQGSLKKHMRTHTGERPYKCEICDYKCRDQSSLKKHTRTHTGERPYKCEICKYKCGDQSSFKKHMRTHTGEKPYKCEICNYKGRQSNDLKRHLRTHTGEKPFKCEICDNLFGEKGNLKSHMKIHTREKPYKCKITTSADNAVV